MAEKIDRFFCAPLQYRYWALTMLSVRLGDLLEIGNGRNYSILKKSGQYPVYGSGGLMGYTDNFLHDGESVLLPRKGTLNNIQFVTGRFWTVDTIYFSRIDDRKVDPYFLFRYLKLLDLKNLNTGTGVPSMTQKVYEDIPLILPTLGTQYNIAKILRLLDKKIKLNNTINARLEEMARNLYNFWFIQFEFPDESGRPFKTAGGEMVYSEELKRKIPVGWRVENLHKNSLTEIIKPKIDIFTDYKMYLDTSTVSGLAIELGEKILYCSRTSRANMQPIANSVWFAKMQSSIKHIIVGEWSRDLIDNTVLSTGFMGLSVKRHALGYVAGYIRNPYFEIVKDSNSHGATMSGIGNDDLKNIKIVVPLENVLRNFNKSTTMLWQQIDRNRQENQRLIELRDWLSPMLVNGQIEVS